MIGPESYNRLQAASKEGVIKLPRHITLTTSSGQRINIGPALTIPNSKKLSRFPLLSLRLGDVFTEVSSLAKSHWRRDEGVNETAEQLDDEDLQLLEEVESALEEEERDTKRKWSMMTLDVAVPPSITKDDLVAHFSSFGVVKTVEFPSEKNGHAAVIFSTEGSAEHCLSVVHHIGHNSSDDLPGGVPMQLKLKGGDGHRPPPPRQLQLNVNPFR